MSQQQNLFTTEQLETSEKVRYLHIVKDGNVVDMSFGEIFDTSAYDTLYAVSYVSSPRFFSRVVKGFHSVKFILGIPNPDLLKQFANNIQEFINIEERVGFWNDSDVEVKEKIQANNVSVRFTAFGNPPESIHSKIYILLDRETQNTRVVIGSANLTENAFVRKGQFEEVLIFDNVQVSYDSCMVRSYYCRGVRLSSAVIRQRAHQSRFCTPDPDVHRPL